MGARRQAVRTAALATALVLAAAGCSGGTSGGGDGTSFVAGDGAYTVVPAEEREAPVDFTAELLSGEGELSLADLRGEVVVLNVWGSWCSPCRDEAPALVDASRQLEGRATFLGINVRDNDAAARRFEEQFGVPYDSVVDRGGRVLLALRGAVPPTAIPTTLVLDREGRLAARFAGAIDETTLVGLVEDVESPAGA